MGAAPRVITSETHPKCVKRAVMEALESAPELGCCLLVTWQAFVDLPFFPKRGDWQVIVDEIKRAVRSFDADRRSPGYDGRRLRRTGYYASGGMEIGQCCAAICRACSNP